jgi:hypothetical protein
LAWKRWSSLIQPLHNVIWCLLLAWKWWSRLIQPLHNVIWWLLLAWKRWSSLIHPLHNVNYALMLLLLTPFLFEEQCNWDSKRHAHIPIFHNNALWSGGQPLVSPQWSQCGIRILTNIMDINGLRTFQGNMFLYLQLKSAMLAYGVLW